MVFNVFKWSFYFLYLPIYMLFCTIGQLVRYCSKRTLSNNTRSANILVATPIYEAHLLHLVKSPFWLFEFIYEACKGSFEGLILHEKHVSGDFLSGQSHLPGWTVFVLEARFSLPLLQFHPSEPFFLFLLWKLKKCTKHIFHIKYFK